MYQPQRIQPMAQGNMMPASAMSTQTGAMMPPNQMVPNKFTGNTADLNQNPQASNIMAQGRQYATENSMTGRNQEIVGQQGQMRAASTEMDTRNTLVNNQFNQTLANVIEKSTGGPNIQILEQNFPKIQADVAASVAMNQELMKPTALGQAAMNSGVMMS